MSEVRVRKKKCCIDKCTKQTKSSNNSKVNDGNNKVDD